MSEPHSRFSEGRRSESEVYFGAWARPSHIKRNICSSIVAASACWVNNRARLVTEDWQDAVGLRRCVISSRRWWIACGQEPVLPAWPPPTLWKTRRRCCLPCGWVLWYTESCVVETMMQGFCFQVRMCVAQSTSLPKIAGYGDLQSSSKRVD